MKTLKGTQKTVDFISLSYYQNGSLDFPCDFCGGSSYKNFQIEKNNKIVFVVCENCLKEVKSGGEE